MKQIVLFGAGKSSTVLIQYLLDHAADQQWQLILADADLEQAMAKLKGSTWGQAVSIDIRDGEKRARLISKADIVISLLPPALHRLLARDCLNQGKNLLTASYIDEDMRLLEREIQQKDLLFLCEMGLDPGIDHMSAMKMIAGIKKEGGAITSFKSHCGGLISPESDTNPWHYKISWNPANIVHAGKAGAIYLLNGSACKKNYESLFESNEIVYIPGAGRYAWYPNRDSLSYIPQYGLDQVSTFVRTTLRHPAFCQGWNLVIKSGLTDERNPQPGTVLEKLSYRTWFDACISSHGAGSDFNDFLHRHCEASTRERIREMFEFLGVLSPDPIPGSHHSPASILQTCLEKKLALQPGDRDMIVMLHELEYSLDNQVKKICSSLVVKGDDSLRTAMAKTVGLPLGIAARLVLNGTIRQKGMCIPITEEIYAPVLKELEENQICFKDQ